MFRLPSPRLRSVSLSLRPLLVGEKGFRSASEVSFSDAKEETLELLLNCGEKIRRNGPPFSRSSDIVAEEVRQDSQRILSLTERQHNGEEIGSNDEQDEVLPRQLITLASGTEGRREPSSPKWL